MIRNYLLRAIVALLSAIVLCTGVQASQWSDQQAERFGAQALEDALPRDAAEMLEDLSPTGQGDLLQSVRQILDKSMQQALRSLRSSAAGMLKILGIVMLCQLMDAFCEDRGKQAAVMTGALAVVAFCGTELHTMAGLGRRTMEDLTNFSNALIPVMAAAATASGCPTTAGGVSALAAFFSSLLIRFCERVLIPGVYAYLALAAADCVLQQSRLKKLRQLLGSTIEWSLKGVAYLFTGFLGATGILSGSADAAAVKTAKSAMSAVVPVVGGIISDAAQTLLTSAAMLKGAIGTFGMAAILAVFALPAVQMGISCFALKIVTAVSGLLGSKLQELLESISGATGYLLAMISTCALICLLTCCCMMKAVQL